MAESGGNGGGGDMITISVKTITGDVIQVDVTNVPPATVADVCFQLAQMQAAGSCVELQGTDGPLEDGKVIHEGQELTMLIMTTLKKDEETSFAEWEEVTKALSCKDDDQADGEKVLEQLRAFLDVYPDLINVQFATAPLLSFAAEATKVSEWRQNCIEELLRRKARVDTMVQGFNAEGTRNFSTLGLAVWPTTINIVELYEIWIVP